MLDLRRMRMPFVRTFAYAAKLALVGVIVGAETCCHLFELCLESWMERDVKSLGLYVGRQYIQGETTSCSVSPDESRHRGVSQTNRSHRFIALG